MQVYFSSKKKPKNISVWFRVFCQHKRSPWEKLLFLTLKGWWLWRPQAAVQEVMTCAWSLATGPLWEPGEGVIYLLVCSFIFACFVFNQFISRRNASEISMLGFEEPPCGFVSLHFHSPHAAGRLKIPALLPLEKLQSWLDRRDRLHEGLGMFFKVSKLHPPHSPRPPGSECALQSWGSQNLLEWLFCLIRNPF